MSTCMSPRATRLTTSGPPAATEQNKNELHLMMCRLPRSLPEKAKKVWSQSSVIIIDGSRTGANMTIMEERGA